ncbi:MAG: sigma-70 family RNA polymerase sigma factor, partial [Planctomycetia bacterium]|nr:sigma-70 family RNA polymerase sigma factor [Planctomycetia bacterium]
MNQKRPRPPSDFVLIKNTKTYFIESLAGKVTDPKLFAAWQCFYRLYDPIIRRFAISCGIRRNLLDEVVPDAWEIVVRALPDFDCDPTHGRFRPWLFARVRNASVDRVRETKRRREFCVGVDFDEHEGPDPRPDQVFERRWNKAVLDDALRVLQGSVSDIDYKLFVMSR